jgi:predicted nucleic acid-binding protein
LIVADTGAIVALADERAPQHRAYLDFYRRAPAEWVLPWAILPEVDYLLENHVAPRAAAAFLRDLATGAFQVEWGRPADVQRAEEICRTHRDSRLGLVDAVVMAVAERLAAEGIATLDLRHFAAVRLKRPVKLYPRDL